MAGSLKVFCPPNSYIYAQSPGLTMLNNVSVFSFSCWFQITSLDGSGATDADLLGSPDHRAAEIRISNNTTINLDSNPGSDVLIRADKTVDYDGHFFVVSYNGGGNTTAYFDNVEQNPPYPVPSVGNSHAFNDTAYVGWDVQGAGITCYYKDMAFYGYALSSGDATALYNGSKNPSTLTTPALHWWTLQGPAGTVTAGTQGLADSIGSVNLSNILTAGVGATLTYDPFEIGGNFIGQGKFGLVGNFASLINGQIS